MFEVGTKIWKFFVANLGSIIVFCLAITAIYLCVIACYYSYPGEAKCAEEQITKVGGCDRNGLCSVELESGQAAFTFYPLQGHKSFVCKCGNNYTENIRRISYNNGYITEGICGLSEKEGE